MTTAARWRAGGRTGAALALVLALLALLGWAFDVQGLRSVLSGSVDMKVNTALSVTALAGTLVVVLRPGSLGSRPVGSPLVLLPLLSALIGAVTVLQYLLGTDLGIDELLFEDASDTTFAGRPGLNTALCLVGLGVALPLLLRGRRAALAQALAAASLLMAFLAVMGYLTGDRELRGFGDLQPMAFNTGFALLSTSIAALAVRPGEGLMARFTSPDASGRLLRRLLPGVLATAVLVTVLRREALTLDLVDEEGAFTIVLIAGILALWGLVITTARVIDAAESRRRRAEAELARYAQDLERSNAELQQFAYVASHDLSEPLRTISGFVQLLERRYRGRLDAQADGYIEHTVAGVERMRALIQDILLYSRVGQAELTIERVDLRALARETGRLFAGAIEESGASLSVADDLPAVSGDRRQLTQLLQNLVGNGLKYHGTDAPRIEVRARDDGAVCVVDHGIGIAPEHRERVFRMFQRLHSREEYPGTGIGLALCRRIAERHGGELWIETTPGGGATFCFTLGSDGDPLRAGPDPPGGGQPG